MALRGWLGKAGRWAVCAALAVPAGCARLPAGGGGGPSVESAPFGLLPDGRAVTVYTLRNGRGLDARILDYGGIVQSLRTPDRGGQPGEVVLGFDTLDDYVRRSPCFGAIVGRYAGRIAFGRFTLDGAVVRLPTNFGRHHLHGGPVGFDRAVWAAESRVTAEGPEVLLRHVSPDGDQGYPGQLTVTCRYTLTTQDVLRIRFTATTDRPTVVNLTHHGYFNLAGAGATHVPAQTIEIPADRVAETDTELIPTGRLLPVEGTPLDLRAARAIGEGLGATNVAIAIARGFDHTWVLPEAAPSLPRGVATLRDPTSGRRLDVSSTQPAITFYVPDFGAGLDGRAGERYTGRGAVCLEPQHAPDSPNRPEFPSTVLRPGETCTQTIEYRFSTDP